MKQISIFSMKSPFRDDFTIPGYYFGNGEKTVAIVGSLRGDEVQQLFVASQIVKNLMALDEAGMISKDHGILVIPSANHYSMNIQKRFWAMDNTDINRMFPGYDQGETTQRIASAIFEAVRGYEYGIQLASYYLSGNFVPHIRVMDTGYQDIEDASAFGLPYVYVYEPRPFDTCVLNYNWQVFETKAFSVYSGSTDTINKDLAKTTWLSILRFLDSKGIIKHPCHPGSKSYVFGSKALHTVASKQAGLFYPLCDVGSNVKKGDLLGKIIDPYTGETRSAIEAPVNGTIFFAHLRPLVHQHSRLFQILSF
ncbi:MAG: M14 family metallopeptidase [Bacteroidales bacterium]|nr:M14 family metallopeptidase [Bacteroidales bacterium]